MLMVYFVFALCTLCCQFLWIVPVDCPFDILYRLFTPYGGMQTIVVYRLSAWLV